jgi:hypothetical protein
MKALHSYEQLGVSLSCTMTREENAYFQQLMGPSLLRGQWQGMTRSHGTMDQAYHW